MTRLRLISSIAFSESLIKKALKIAFVVGIILNLINQGDKIVSLLFNEINYFKSILTFCVPFCVSMYTAISMKLKFQVGEKAAEHVLLRCTNCNGCLEVKKDQIVPFCYKCAEKTNWKLTSFKDKKCQHKK
ncbi:nitrate/nitrite transporter NrtS [Halarcobacter bivalviorum]|uniref:Membrane protein n=1 Tax=Halarcobacter bivalviorum TaxID=663364 RepID=A0AAX2A8T8_9BACT|nr:nitrate/nitrite transporter NrtS [Halarcobacter bivalviorum]AXH13337.1 putative membrane protein [Halarcobacter bivalviorum]RXK10057.1 hypothetical protein CRV05_06685 [Halarcobacter bivalviorum]